MKKNSLLILILVSLFSISWSACDESVEQTELQGTSSQRIVGGQDTGFHSWKGVVALVSKINGMPAGICTGTLIAPDIVLTAGHCVKMKGDGFMTPSYDHTQNPENLLVKSGEMVGVAGAKGDLISNVKQAIHHPTWTGDLNEVVNSGGADLAIVHLETPVTTLGHYCIREGDMPSKGDKGIIVGYGLLNTNKQFSGGVHRWGETSIQEVNKPTFEIGDPTATCSGDSGGPLFTQVDGDWRVTGVTSYGGFVCLPKQGAFSSNVVTFSDWINDTVEELTGNSLGNCTLTDADLDTDFTPDDEDVDNDTGPEIDDDQSTLDDDVENDVEDPKDDSDIDEDVEENDDSVDADNTDSGESLSEDGKNSSSGGCSVSSLAHRPNSIFSLLGSLI